MDGNIMEKRNSRISLRIWWVLTLAGMSCSGNAFSTLLGDDLDSPYIQIISPASNAEGLNVDTVTVTGTYGIFIPEKVTLYYGPGSPSTAVTATIQTSTSTWEATITGLTIATSYSFMAQATDADGKVIESSVISAKTRDPAIAILSPNDGASIINSGGVNVIGNWQYFTPVTVTLYYGTDTNPLDDASVVVGKNDSAQTWSHTLGALANSTTYYIQAKATNAAAETILSPVRSFTTVDPTNIQFTLVNPADGETFVSNSITFSGHLLSINGGSSKTEKFELLIDGAPYAYVAGDLTIKKCTTADGGDADQYCDAYGATCATATDHTNTALDCDCSGLGCDWFIDTSGLTWNTWMTIGGRFTDDLANTYTSNAVQIISQQKLSFGETIVAVPADESFSGYINYTDLTDPVIIVAIKPSEDTDSYVDGTPGGDEDTDSAFPIISLESGNKRFRVRVMNSDDGGARKRTEDVWYFMVEANTATNQHYVLSDGNELEAGNITLDKAKTYNTFQTVTFLKPFSAAPLVFTQQISDANGRFLIQRIRNVSVTGFEVAFQPDDGDPAPGSDETVSYVAVDLVNSTVSGNHTYSYGIFNGKRFQIGRKGQINHWNGGTENDQFAMAHLYATPLVFVGLNTSGGGEPAYGRIYKYNDDGSYTWIYPFVEDVQVAGHLDETIVYFTVESN